jgi:hypothetical protein
VVNKNLINDLIELLKGGQAHLRVERILNGIMPKYRHFRIQKGLHTIYEELEHIRIAQEDIIQYMLDRTWNSPPWPEGYWPPQNINVTDEVWDTTKSSFLEDLNKLIKFVQKSNIDLTQKIPHRDGHTYLREILLVADHNAYHLGKIMHLRKILENSTDKI